MASYMTIRVEAVNYAQFFCPKGSLDYEVHFEVLFFVKAYI